MSGGIFYDYPFTLNIKCIIFSLIIMIIYSYCPPNFESKLATFLTYFIIFVISYVGLAWYDYYYQCTQLPLMRGKYSFTGLFKPPIESTYTMSEVEINKNTTMIYLLHLIIIVPLLSYIGIMKNNTNPRFFDILLVVCVMTSIYHGSKLIGTSHNL